MTLSKRCFAEFLGTFGLVFGGCGSAVLLPHFRTWVLGSQVVALAFGLTLLTMAFTIGPISGCHIKETGRNTNESEDIGSWASRRWDKFRSTDADVPKNFAGPKQRTSAVEV